MILRAIRIAGWRCFLESVEVGPFQEGLNVLHAPNATGKSTLFEGLLRGLLDGHRVGGQEVAAIRPWGRSLAPTVTVEFFHEGTDYRIMKRFLDNPESRLERKENGRFVPLAENNKADEKVRAILTRNAPMKGLARLEHWGLAQVLWAPQGDLALGKLSGDVIADIRASLGTQVSGTGPVEKGVAELYGQFFTSGGKLKSGKDAPALVGLKDELEDALARKSNALSQQQAFDEAARRIEDLRARRTQAKNDEDAIKKLLGGTRLRADSYKGLSSERKQREERLKAITAQHGELKSHLDAIKSARKEFKEAGDSLHKIEEAMPLQQREMESREKEDAHAKAALEDIRKERKAVDDAQKIADQAHRYLENNKALATLDRQMGNIIKAQEALAACKKERAGLLSPDAMTLRAIRKALRERDEAQVRIDAALITLEVTPEKDGILVVIEGEETGSEELRPGTPARVKGSPEVVADLPGVARLRAWGPTVSIEQHRSELAAAERELKILTMPFGTTNIEELEALGEKAEQLGTRVAEAETQLKTLLSGESVEDIERERSMTRMARANILQSHPEWKDAPPDDETLKMAALHVHNSFVNKVEAAERRWELAQSALTAAATQKAQTSAKLEETSRRIKLLESRLAELTADGKSDEERENRLREVALSWEGARVSLEEIDKKLAEFGDDPAIEIDKLERQLDAAGKAVIKALEDEKSEEGRMWQLSAQGTYSVLAQAEEEVANLKSQIESEQLRLDAVRLMYETVKQCREEALAAVAGPVEETATRTLQRIAGERLGRLQLGESFEPAHVLPEVLGESVALDNVSGGEREQIYLATRLALAEVLAKNERQLVVLDDVLAATDAGRLARVMTILEEAAQRLQILILTCHPERYRGLGGANLIDLEGVVRGDRV
ncbi:MAG: AAA family ATPase [Dehalococcoidia bacterium]|nr:AAA family ATPase [Dehalococcoidia bacterium]